MNKSHNGGTMEQVEVDPRIYANPIYLAGLFERIKDQRSWKSVKKIFDAEIEEMEKRIPRRDDE